MRPLSSGAVRAAARRGRLKPLSTAGQQRRKICDRKRHHGGLVALRPGVAVDIGQPHLEKQIAVITSLLRVSDDKDECKKNVEKLYPGTFPEARQGSFLKMLDSEDEG